MVNFFSKRRVSSLLVAGFAALFVVACGGGKSDEPQQESVDALAKGGATTLSIKSFSPSTAAAGGTVTVNGSGFNDVRTVSVNGVAATFSVSNSRSVSLVVPATATTGPIQVTTAAGAAASKSSLVIASATAQISSVSPTTVLEGGTLQLSGTNLDKVNAASINGYGMTIASKSSSSVTLVAPSAATKGSIAVTDGSGSTSTSPQSVTVVAPMSVGGFAPLEVVKGQQLTISGSGLDRATSVVFSGGASASIASRSGTTSIVVSVPEAAQSGVFVVNGNAGDSVSSGSAVTVVAPIRVDGSASFSANAGGSVSIPGTGLASVTGVNVGSTSASMTSKSDTQVTFVVPQGVACGAITLLASNQPAVSAGSLVVGAGCSGNVRSAGIEFAQTLSQPSSDARQRLVPGKDAVVRAYVVSGGSGTAAPAVRVTAYAGNSVLGTLAMTGPSTLPAVSSGISLPDSVRYDESQSFNAKLPASWVVPNLSVRVEIDPAGIYGNPVVTTATPQMGADTRLNVVLVPIVSGPYTGTVPPVQEVVTELTRRFPVAASDITVSVRSPYTISTTSDGVDTSAEWSGTVQEMEQLRRREAPNKLYYGFVKKGTCSGIVGVSYTNSPTSTSPSLSSLGIDATCNWQQTFIHELGHSLSRKHAPCGNVSNADPDYPYAGGVLSATPLADSIPASVDILSPAGLADVMGYCGGTWFSDYNYREIQRFAEMLVSNNLISYSVGSAGSTDLMMVAGTISEAGVRFEPVQMARGVPTASGQTGSHRLRLALQGGESFDVAFTPVELADAGTSESHFVVTVPNRGALARLDVLKDGRTLPERADNRARGRGTQAEGGPAVEVRESNRRLELNWSAETTPYASVTFVKDGERRVLAVNSTGGRASIDVSTLPAGGELEVSLSDGLNARLFKVAR